MLNISFLIFYFLLILLYLGIASSAVRMTGSHSIKNLTDSFKAHREPTTHYDI